ncbi:hypothetical protein EV127DRAFT_434406 [Xylaria flabelliformis]|nr:hypothetical protein EV127DRAFT_434406 [Xylaria flabelliformis]
MGPSFVCSWAEGEPWLDQNNQTSLHIAIIYGNDESVVQVLLEYGLPVHITDKDGSIAPGYALVAWKERPGVVELLLQYGANLDGEPLLEPRD